jgi:hypothetical protein
MHGLIFVTWEQYLAERFGSDLLHTYRATIGETAATAPLASRVYDDATLLAGVGAACELTKQPAEVLLRDYGRYFIVNGLTRHRCAYLLNQVQHARDLLLVMRDAHAQMGRTPDGLTPPLFGYQTRGPDHLTLIYDSSRQLCPVLWGAIEGAAQRYGDDVHIEEHTCMKRGDAVCRFELRFVSSSSGAPPQPETREQQWRKQRHRQMTELVWAALPEREGITLAEMQQRVQQRPYLLVEALQHLQHAGLVSSTGNRPNDTFPTRRYWRAPTSDEPRR